MSRHGSLHYTDHEAARLLHIAGNVATMRSTGSVVTTDSAMSEKQLLRHVREIAHLLGFKTYHTYSSLKSEQGFFDLILAKEHQPLICAELKTTKGCLTIPQQEWYNIVSHVKDVSCYVWRPGDLPSIAEILKGR